MIDYKKIICTLQERENEKENLNFDLFDKTTLESGNILLDEVNKEYEKAHIDTSNKLENYEWCCIKTRISLKFYLTHLIKKNSLLDDFIEQCNNYEFSRDYFINDILYIMISFVITNRNKISNYDIYKNVLNELLIYSCDISKWTEENIYFHNFIIVNNEEVFIKKILKILYDFNKIINCY